MSKIISQGKCSNCGSSDACTTYDDGHSWCYSCRKYVPPTNTLENMYKRLQRNTKELNTITLQGKKLEPLPDDCSMVIGVEALRWLKSYGITDKEIKSSNIVWSAYRQMLIFPSYDNDMNLLHWQGRYFPQRNPKCYTQGDNNHITLFPATETALEGVVVVCEDYLSALKVSRYCDSLCLFGSHVPPKLISKLRQQGYESIWFWLDYNKGKDSQKFRDKYGIFVKTRSIVTEKDPKEYDSKSIENILLTE